MLARELLGVTTRDCQAPVAHLETGARPPGSFGRLHREGLTILLAEQSIELALEVSDFATVLQVGKSVLSGTAAALAQDPQVQKAYLGA